MTTLAERIAVGHLLTHSSGLDGDVFDDTGRGDDAVERYIALLADVERTFGAGCGVLLIATAACVAAGIGSSRCWTEAAWDESLQVTGSSNRSAWPTPLTPAGRRRPGGRCGRSP